MPCPSRTQPSKVKIPDANLHSTREKNFPSLLTIRICSRRHTDVFLIFCFLSFFVLSRANYRLFTVEDGGRLGIVGCKGSCLARKPLWPGRETVCCVILKGRYISEVILIALISSLAYPILNFRKWIAYKTRGENKQTNTHTHTKDNRIETEIAGNDSLCFHMLHVQTSVRIH